MTTQLRLLTGGTALVAGLYFLTAVSAAPPLDKDVYKAVAEADVAQLQKHLETINTKPDQVKRYAPTAKALAVMLATYGEATGDEALKTAAGKTAEAIGKKDYKGAAEAAKGLAVKAGSAPLKSSDLAKTHKFSLEEVMSPFRGSKVGGLNIEKDIRDTMNGKIPVDPATIELIGARTAVLGEYSVTMPNDKASTNDANKKKWEGWSKDMVEMGKKLSDMGAKGKAADSKEIIKLLKSLDAKCSDCHNAFRD